MSSNRTPPSVSDKARLDVIADLEIHAPLESEEFDALANLAAGIMDCPVGLVSLVLSDRQVFLGSSGSDIRETPIEDAFCAFTIAADDETLVVPDTHADPRFAESRFVKGPTKVRFYAGAAIRFAGQKIGTVCVVDDKARKETSSEQIGQLTKLARLASILLETKSSAYRQDQIDQQRCRAEFRHSLALRAATIASWMWNVNSNTVSTDDTMSEWVDLDFSSSLSMQDLLTIVHPDDIENVRVALDMAMGEDDDFRCEFRVRSSDKWLMGQGRVFERASDGTARSMAGVFVDITETKRAEQTTRLLLRELNHRVKNTLAMLQSLAAQTLKTTPSPDQFMRAFSGRLQALAAVHTLLSDNKWHKVSVHDLLRTLITPYAPRYREGLEIEGTDVLIGPEEGLGLGLVIHELATNAARYGALSGNMGTVKLICEVTGPPDKEALNLEWREIGGPPVNTDRTAGLGTILIERGLQKILKSSVQTEFDTPGAVTRISFPLVAETK